MHSYINRNLAFTAIILVASQSLVGCAGSPAHTLFIAPNEINETLSEWVGKDIGEAVNRYGPPTKVTALSGMQFYEWREEGDSTCRWWLRFNEGDNKIDDSGASGNTYHCYTSMNTN